MGTPRLRLSYCCGVFKWINLIQFFLLLTTTLHLIEVFYTLLILHSWSMLKTVDLIKLLKFISSDNTRPILLLLNIHIPTTYSHLLW